MNLAQLQIFIMHASVPAGRTVPGMAGLVAINLLFFGVGIAVIRSHK